MGFFGIGKDKRGAHPRDLVVKLPQVPQLLFEASTSLVM